MLLASPPNEEVKHIRNKLDSCVVLSNQEKIKTRFVQQGRLTCVSVHVGLPNNSDSYNVNDLAS